MFDDWSDPEDMEEQEELEASLRRFQQMVEHDGHAFFDEDEYIFIIDHYMSLDELDMAERAISNALERYPDNVPLILRHVGLLSARQKMDAALNLLRRTDAEHPDVDGITLYEEAVLYMDLQQWDMADAKFKAVLELPKAERDEVMQDPNFYNDISEMNAIRDRIVVALVTKVEAIRRETAPISDLNDLFRHIHDEKGYLPYAIEVFTSRTDEDPLSALDWLCLGKALMEDGQYYKATEAFRNMQAICGEESEATAEIAAIHILTGFLQSGEKSLEQYFSLCRTSREERLRWYNQIAQYAYDRSNLSVCMRFSQKAIDTDNMNLYSHLLMALALGENEQYAEAVQEMGKVLRIQPDHLDAMLLTGEYLKRDMRTEEAGELFKKCLDLFPDDEKTWNAYTHFLIGEGELDEAIGLLEQAVTVMDQPCFLYQLAYCYLRKEDKSMGRFYLNMAYAESPGGLQEFLQTDRNLIVHPEVLSFLNEIKYNN